MGVCVAESQSSCAYDPPHEEEELPTPAPLSHIQAAEGTQMSHSGVAAAARSKASGRPSAQDSLQVLCQLENATWPKVTSFQGPSTFKVCRRHLRLYKGLGSLAQLGRNLKGHSVPEVPMGLDDPVGLALLWLLPSPLLLAPPAPAGVHSSNILHIKLLPTRLPREQEIQ